MKRDFHNDIEQENFDIACKILDDSNRLNTENAFNEKVFQKIRNTKKADFRKTSRKTIYAIASAAACILLIVSVGFGIGYANGGFGNRKSSTTLVINPASESSEDNEISSGTAVNTIHTAKDYTEIYTRLMSATQTIQTDNVYVYSESTDSMGSKQNGSMSAAADSSGGNYYDTNEQTENVHEADVVKTDGKYIYTLTYQEKKEINQIIITKANGMKLKKMSVISFPKDDSYTESVLALYVHGDTLIAVSRRYRTDGQDSSSASASIACYDVAYFDNTETVLYTYDISDRKNPSLISTNVQDGDYISSRQSDHYLYTISNKIMDTLTKDDCVPSVNSKRMDCSHVYLPLHIDGREYSVITVLDLNDTKDFHDSVAVAGSASTLYVSQDNLYLIGNIQKETDISDTTLGKKLLKNTHLKKYDHKKVKVKKKVKKAVAEIYENIDADTLTAYKETKAYRSTDNIQIIKYHYHNGAVKYVADTSVDGYSYDNLNFDEKDGYLRCVTTESSSTCVETRINYYDEKGNFLFYSEDEYDYKDPEKETSNVFVLDDSLTVKAEINNIAKGESIYSSRFFGDYGYFVTYRNTDPLFSVDFSDMENPKIIGKLKLSGFSQYLHFYKDDLLFGLGMETDEKSGEWECVKLEMYRLKDGNAAQEAKTTLKEYDYADAMDNYKAVLIDSEKKLIGFAAYSYTAGNDGFSYLLYTYDNQKFRQLFTVDLDKYDYELRSLYINDYLYLVSPDDGIRVLNYKTYAKDKKVEYKKF